MEIMVDTRPVHPSPAQRLKSNDGALPKPNLITSMGLVSGVMGGTATLFGGILYAIDPLVWPLALANIGFGGLCLLLYTITHRHLFTRVMAGRSTPLIILEIVMALGVLSAGFAVNWFAAKNPIEWDLSQDRIYSLHSQSIAVAERLDKPIDIYAFYRPQAPTRGVLTEAVDLYQLHSPHLALHFINPDQAPTDLLKRFEINARSTRIVFVDKNSGNYTKIKRPTEEAMTNALIRITENRQQKVYILEGHGEPGLKDNRVDGFLSATTQLSNEGLIVETLTLVDRSDVPVDANVVIVAGAKSALLPNEVASLSVYIDRGGRVLFLLEPGFPHGLDQLLNAYGIVVNDDLVVDNNPAAKALGFGADAPIIQSYEPHAITRVMNRSFTMFLRVRSLQLHSPITGGTNTPLIQTRNSAWAEAIWDSDPTSYVLDKTDTLGPLVLAASATRPTASHPKRISEEARLVVVGDYNFATNRFSNIKGNLDFFVNTVHWLVGSEDNISIRPPKRSGDRLPLTEQQQYGIMFFSVNLLPLLITGIGFSVWAIRRRK